MVYYENNIRFKKSYNNYYWKNEEELKDYLKYAINVLWEHYEELHNGEIDKQNVEDRLYDILDMFEDFKIEKE